MTGLGHLRRSSDRATGRREPTQLQMGIGLLLGLIGAVVGTVVGLIVLTIVVGLAGGHT